MFHFICTRDFLRQQSRDDMQTRDTLLIIVSRVVQSSPLIGNLWRACELVTPQLDAVSCEQRSLNCFRLQTFTNHISDIADAAA